MAPVPKNVIVMVLSTNTSNQTQTTTLIFSTELFKYHYMYRQFNIQQLYVLPTQRICVFCVDLRANSDYFTILH